MAEQQTSLTLRVSHHVHVGGLCRLGVSLLIKGLPGDLCVMEVAVGCLTAYTLALVGGQMRWIKGKQRRRKKDIQSGMRWKISWQSVKRVGYI